MKVDCRRDFEAPPTKVSKFQGGILAQQLWFTVLSSSVVSAIIGALIAGSYHLRSKRNEYVNEYFKTVIQRRLAAYEQLERLIISLKTAVIDTDNKPYHLLFSDDEDLLAAYKLLSDAMQHSLWLSDAAFEKVRDLNYKVFRLSRSESGAIQFGKENYKEIAKLREELEKVLAIDMLSLHNVENFLKYKKKKQSGFHEVRLDN